jgi:hypothetical protein
MFSCTEKGEDMSEGAFKKALELSAQIDDAALTIGGGEPTLHPQFWQFLGLALGQMRHYRELYIGIVTNGSQTDTALALAAIAAEGLISACLSQDQWHDPIDERVVRAFKTDWNSRDGDKRSIRTIESVQLKGRGKKLGHLAHFNQDCDCQGLEIEPSGIIYSCNCRKERFGNVFNPQLPSDWSYVSSEGYCYKRQKSIRKKLEQERLDYEKHRSARIEPELPLECVGTSQPAPERIVVSEAPINDSSAAGLSLAGIRDAVDYLKTADDRI